MTRFINRLTGSVMWVSDTRIEEYKAAGHKLAASDPAPTPKKAEPKKSTKAKR